MQRAEQSASPPVADPPAGERYLLLADISGYTGFMSGVENAHGIDFGSGIPAAYSVLGDLLNAVIEGIEPAFDIVKLEGDAVFGAAPAERLDGRGGRVLVDLSAMYASFIEGRTAAIPASDHMCTACPAVANLDLKVVMHRGQAVRQTVGSGWDLLGPAVTIAHRLLKNTVREKIGDRPYLLMTDAAAGALGSPTVGIAHLEQVPEAGTIDGRIILLDEPTHEGASA